jgi:hypothetical protein
MRHAETPLIAPVNPAAIHQIVAMDSFSPEPTPIRVVVGGVPYEVGFDADSNPLFVRTLSWRADGIKQIYTSKTIWEASFGAPSLIVDAVIRQARRRMQPRLS